MEKPKQVKRSGPGRSEIVQVANRRNFNILRGSTSSSDSFEKARSSTCKHVQKGHNHLISFALGFSFFFFGGVKRHVDCMMYLIRLIGIVKL